MTTHYIQNPDTKEIESFTDEELPVGRHKILISEIKDNEKDNS